MEKTISSLRDAHNRYIAALAAVLAEFQDDGSYRIQESAVLNLSEHHERFLMALKDYEASQQEADPSAAEEVAPLQDTASQSRDSLVLSSKGQGDEAHMSGVLGAAAGKALADLDLEIIHVLKETVGTDNMPAPEMAVVHEASQQEANPSPAEEVAPLQETASQSRGSLVLSSKGQGDETHMSGVLGAAVGKALADLDLDLEIIHVLKETVGTDNMPAPEMAVVHEASQQEANPSAAEEVAPLQETASQSRGSLVLSSKGQGDETHMSGVLGAAVGKALADLDLEGHVLITDNTPALEEAVVHQMATLQATTETDKNDKESTETGEQLTEHRDWAGLPSGVMGIIFHKMGFPDMVMNAIQVCKYWRQCALEDPSHWKIMDMSAEAFFNKATELNPEKMHTKLVRNLVVIALEKGGERVEELRLFGCFNIDLANHISIRALNLQKLSLIGCQSKKLGIKLHHGVARFSRLVELEMKDSYSIGAGDIMERILPAATQLKSLKLRHVHCHLKAGENGIVVRLGYPTEDIHLIRLELVSMLTTNEELLAILKRCTRLQNLDLRNSGNLEEAQIRAICMDLKSVTLGTSILHC